MKTQVKIILILLLIVIIVFVIVANKRKKAKAKSKADAADAALMLEAYTNGFNEEEASTPTGKIVDTSGTTETDDTDAPLNSGIPTGSFGGGILDSELTTGSVPGDMIANLGINVGVDVIKNRILRGIGKTVSSRVIFRTHKRIAQSAGKVLTKMVGRNPQLLIKLGYRMGQGAGKFIATSAAKAAGTTATKAATKATAKLASVGPLIIFDAISMIMDMADVAGYGKLTTKAVYAEARRSAEAELKAELLLLDPPIAYPIVFSPIGQLLNDEELLIDELDKYTDTQLSMDPATDPELKRVQDILLSDSASGIMKESIDDYIDLIDLNKVIDTMLDAKCVELGGELRNGGCTYTAVPCEERNVWPRSEDSESFYTEWDSITQQCIMVGAAERTLCEENGLEYNLEERVCEFTELYCQTKAAEFVDGNCEIPTEQAVFALIFGDTIVSSLKQLFSMDQYEECPYYGEIRTSSKSSHMDNSKCVEASGDGSVTSALCTDKLIQRFYYIPRTKTIHTMGENNWIITVKSDTTDVKVGDKVELKKISEDKISDLQKWDYDKETKQFTNNNLALTVEGSELSMQTKTDHPNQRFWMRETTDVAFQCGIEDAGNVSACPKGYNASSASNIDCSIDKPIRKADCYTVYKGPLKSLSGPTVGGGDYIHDNSAKYFTTVDDDTKCLSSVNNTLNSEIKVVTKTSGDSKQQWIYNWMTKAIWNTDNTFVIQSDNNGQLTLQKYNKDKTNQQFDIEKWDEASYTNNGITCGAGGLANSNIDNNGIVGTPSCPTGTINNGLGMCAGSFRREGWDDTFSNGNDDCCEQYGDDDEKQKCIDNPEYLSRNCEYHSGGIFPKCEVLAKQQERPMADKWRWTDGQANACTFYQAADKVGKCPTEYSFNDQGFCYANCEKLYGPGWYNNGTNCALPVDVKGMASMSCFADEYRTSNGNCSKKCPIGDIDMGILGTCMAAQDTMVCKDTQFISGSRCYNIPPPMFSRVELTNVLTMNKRRVVPFSNTEN